MNHDPNAPPPAIFRAYLRAFRTFETAMAGAATATSDVTVPAFAFLTDPAVKALADWAGGAAADLTGSHIDNNFVLDDATLG